GNRVVVERAEFAGQLQAPAADRAGALERQVALVPQVNLKETTIVLAATRGDRLDAPEVCDEPRVVDTRVGQVRISGGHADAVTQQRERAVDAGVGAGHARDGQPHGL